LAKSANIPRERHKTIRQELLKFLDGTTASIGTISRELGESEKNLYDYLSQLNETRQLSIIPAKCLKCGYKFEHRKKIKKPSKCPVCKSTYIRQPAYTLKN
jgi:hypothetical protein